MADAKLASSPSVTGDGGAASTVPPRAIEGTTAAVATACGESASVEETPEARALAQGAYSRPISLFYYHSPGAITMIVEFYFADTNLPYDKSVPVFGKSPTPFDHKPDSCGHFTPPTMSTGFLLTRLLHLSACVSFNFAASNGSSMRCAQVPSSK